MTWRTPDGERWLTGAEATLVREALAYMLDEISFNIADDDDEPLCLFGVRSFDECTPTQQLVVAKSVAEHLLTKTEQPLELTAINEAAVYAIFRTVVTQIEFEIDTEDDREASERWFWRHLTLNAYQECMSDEVDDELIDGDRAERAWMTPQSVASRNFEQWESLTESLADLILWDRDFEMAGRFLDAEPAQAALLKQMLGIETDYYSDAAPDLRVDEVEEFLRSVRQLTHQHPR